MSPIKDNLDQISSQNFGTSSSLVQQAQKTPLIGLNPQQTHSRQEMEEQNAEQNKYTMESLCRSFIKKYANTTSNIQTSTITIQFGAKLRRVYDMTNILQGGGIIEKVEKGTYRWKFNYSNYQFQVEQIRCDWCSLRNISRQLRHLFYSAQQGLTCHNIYDLLTSGKKLNFNPSTIRRRIYECCKVFTIAGLIRKIGKNFYNVKLNKIDAKQLIKQQKLDQLQKSQLYKIDEKLTENNVKTYKMGQSNDNESKKYETGKRKQVIKKLVTQLKNSEDLQNFIQELTVEYHNKIVQFGSETIQSKLSQFKESLLKSTQWSHQSVDYQSVCDAIQSQSPIHKNIIVSSGNSYSFFVSKNSSFCSFSENQAMKMYPQYQTVKNLKGK